MTNLCRSNGAHTDDLKYDETVAMLRFGFLLQ